MLEFLVVYDDTFTFSKLYNNNNNNYYYYYYWAQ